MMLIAPHSSHPRALTRPLYAGGASRSSTRRRAASGVVLLANNAGTYRGEDGQHELWTALHARSAVVFIHPAELPGPTVPGIPPCAADFLVDTTRAAYLLVRNGIRRRNPNIGFNLSHAGGFVPYASHRMAVSIMGDTGRSPADSLDDFAGFDRDNALALFPRLGSAPPTGHNQLRGAATAGS